MKVIIYTLAANVFICDNNNNNNLYFLGIQQTCLNIFKYYGLYLSLHHSPSWTDDIECIILFMCGGHRIFEFL